MKRNILKNAICLIIPFVPLFLSILIFQGGSIYAESIGFILLYCLPIVWIILCSIYRFCNVWIIPCSFLLVVVTLFIITTITGDVGAIWLFGLSTLFYSIPFLIVSLLIAITKSIIAHIRRRYFDKDSDKEVN